MGGDYLSASAASTLNLDDLASQLGGIHWRLATQLEDLTWAHYDVPPELAIRYSQVLSEAQAVIERIDQLARATSSASTQYAWREGVVTSMSEQAIGHVMYLAGKLLPALPAAVAALAPELAIGTVFLVGGVLIYRSLSHERASTTGRWVDAQEVFLKEQFGAIGSRFVALAVSGADNFLAGALSLPEASLEGLGPQGISAAATGVATFLSVPFLVETPVSVTRVSASETSKPHSLAAMISRIPHGEQDGAQIRIEKYDETHLGSTHSYIVYVGGTADASWSPKSEPWDMTSNVTALGNGESGSERAVVAAMRQAGIHPGDSVTMVGHSQGGLVAARIAQSGDFHVTHVVTAGAPIHNIDLPEQTQLIALEHTEDVIPSLSGVDTSGPTAATVGTTTLSGITALVTSFAPTNIALTNIAPTGIAPTNLSPTNTTQPSNELVIRNSTFNEKAPQAGHSLAAHSLERYVATAKQVDNSSDPRAVAARIGLFEEISSASGRTGTAQVPSAQVPSEQVPSAQVPSAHATTAQEATAQVTMWHAHRIPPS